MILHWNLDNAYKSWLMSFDVSGIVELNKQVVESLEPIMNVIDKLYLSPCVQAPVLK